MSRRFDVAVIGADSAVGGAVLELLAERRFPVGELFALAVQVDVDATVDFAGREQLLDAAADFDFRQAQLAFLAAGDEDAVTQAQRAADAGCVVIDAANVAWPDPRIPRVVAAVNPQDLAGFNERGLVAAPDRIAAATLPALAPLSEAGALRRVRVTAVVPVSDGGAAAQEDLARETMALLNARAYERQYFPQQIAFNIHGQIGDASPDGRTERERRVADDLRRYLGDAELIADVELLQGSCFFGYGIAVGLDFVDAVDPAWAADRMRAAADVELVDLAGAADCPSPVVDATRSAVVRIARLRAGDGGRTLAFWLVADNIRCAAALNAVRCAELLAREHL